MIGGMPRVIANPGWVLLQEYQLPLEWFSVVEFDADRSYARECELAEDLRARLRGRKGYFVISGQVSASLLATVEDGRTFTVCCEYRAGTLKADVEVAGEPIRLGEAITRFHFSITENIYFCMPPAE